MAEAKEVIYCDYCFEEGQTINATAFCGKCGKYLCSSCVKQHGRFLPDHKLISGSEMPNKEKGKACLPCEIHIGEFAELYCEEHKDLFCNFCKLVKHRNCIVKTLGEVVKGTNVKLQFETSYANLLTLQEVMENKRKENQHKLDTYSKIKRDMKNQVRSLQQELNDIFDTYAEQMDNTEQSVLENLNAKVQSYMGLLSNLSTKLKAKNSTVKGTSGEGLFMSVVEMNQLYDSYMQLVNTLELEVADPKSFALQDERLPSVIQKLHQISSIKEVGCADVEVEEEPAPADSCHSNIMKDQSCQEGDFSQDYSEEKTEGVQVCNSALTTMDDAEHGSSDDVTEQAVITYPKVSFSDIKSWSCSLESELKYYGISDCCFMPDGQTVLCTSSRLIVLDSDMKEKVQLLPQKTNPSPNAIDVMDSKNVVVSVPAAKLLQIISIIPNPLKLGRKIDLKCKCSGLKYHNNKIFIYSNNLFETAGFMYPGIQALDRNGELLKTIPIFDRMVKHFCLTRNGNIVYSCYIDSQKYQIKCITQDNTDIFSYPVSNSMYSFIPDDEGNVIIHDSSTVSVIMSDGTPGKVLVDRKGKENSLQSMYHNRYTNTLFVWAGKHEYTGPVRREANMQLYKIEFS